MSAGSPFDPRVVRDAYDAVADDYDEAFGDTLERSPFDRSVLEAAGGVVPGGLPVVDLGCGPAEVGRYLAGLGASVVGLDLSLGMLATARRHVLQLPLAASDMRSLPLRSGSCGGIVAFYSVQYLRREEVPALLTEVRRVLVAGGVLVVAVHLGEGEVFVDEFMGRAIETVGGTYFAPGELEALVERASFEIAEVRHRGALPGEHSSQRAYLIARAV